MRVLSGIYLIINTVNGKIYIGSSVDIIQRWFEHSSTIERNTHKNKHLQAAFNKYEFDAFHFCIVEECLPEKLLEIEQLWLNGSFGENCYNKSPIAGNTFGKSHSEETKLKISIARKGQSLNFTPEYRKELAARVAKARTKANPSALKTRLKVSASLLGNQRNRKSDKWPHGCKCKCRECKDKRNSLIVEWKFGKLWENKSHGI